MSATKKPYVIVVGVDYSPLGDLALEQALLTGSQQERAEIHAINVVRNFGEFVQIELSSGAPYNLSLAEASERLREHVQKKVEEFAAAKGNTKPLARIVSHVRLEFAAEEIAQLASDLDADLIIVGTHGRRGFRRFLLGSVAEAVVRLATSPVLVVRPKSAEAELQQTEELCARCAEVRKRTRGKVLWCDEHRERPERVGTVHPISSEQNA